MRRRAQQPRTRPRRNGSSSHGDPNLPPTNNEAERALRHAVIARRISFGTRTDEGSRFYAAALSVIDTCRRRGVETWGYVGSLIAAARASLPPPAIPTRAVA